MPTTKIQVTAADNELYILALTAQGVATELCHLKSGGGTDVNHTMVLRWLLPPGPCTLIMVGINWSGPQAFRVIVTTDGVETSYAAPASSVVGANWTRSVAITV